MDLKSVFTHPGSSCGHPRSSVNAVPLPLCFVLMPFGRKPGPGGITIDFGAVYQSLIASAIRDAGLEPLRAEKEQVAGVIHKSMIERLMLCERAIADLTTANASVFHELGLRHRIKPFSTTLIFAERDGLPPVDVGTPLRLPYHLGPDGKPSRVEPDRAALVARLNAARERHVDSPVSRSVDGVSDMQRVNIDVPRDRVQYAQQFKARLAAARKDGVAAVRSIEAEIAGLPGGISEAEAGVIVDLFLSYRDIKAWPEMIALVRRMAAPLAAATMIREQLGFALNRAGDADEAERVLLNRDRGHELLVGVGSFHGLTMTIELAELLGIPEPRMPSEYGHATAGDGRAPRSRVLVSLDVFVFCDINTPHRSGEAPPRRTQWSVPRAVPRIRAAPRRVRIRSHGMSRGASRTFEVASEPHDRRSRRPFPRSSPGDVDAADRCTESMCPSRTPASPERGCRAGRHQTPRRRSGPLRG
jgi:hypothetical protein